MKKGDEILDGFPQDVIAKLVAYLSGSLSADQRELFEARILEHEFFSQQIEEAQFALLEAYAEGSLPREVHEHLTPWASSSDYARQHIAISRSLERISSSSSLRGVRNRTVWLLAIAACLLLAAFSPMFLQRHSAPSVVAKLEPQRGATPAPAPPENTILLIAERLRGANSSTLSLETYQIREDSPLRLQIVLPSSRLSSSYSVVVRSDRNNKLMAQFAPVKVQGLAGTPYVEVVLPPHTLPSGEYTADVRSPADLFHLRFRTADLPIPSLH
jgi:anti-sigma-K factor RskA